jgi:hypothetical protein
MTVFGIAPRMGQMTPGPRVLPHLPVNINALRNLKARGSAVPIKTGVTAKTLADCCLGYLAEDPAQLAEFMNAAGYSPASLRRAVGSTQLAGGLVDYFAANEALMLAVCANNGLKPEDFMRVWQQLNPAG